MLVRRIFLGGLGILTGVWAMEAVEIGADTAFADGKSWVFEGGDWRFENGRLTQTNYRIIPKAFYQGGAFGDVSVEVRFRAHEDGNGVKAAGLILRSQSSQRSYHVHYDTKNNQVILLRWGRAEEKRELARTRGLNMEPYEWYTARAEMAENRITVYLDGKQVAQGTDDSLTAGYVGLYTSQGSIDFEGLKINGTPAELTDDWRIEMPHEVPADQAIATIMGTRVLCKQPGRYIGWPTVCRTRDNELLVVFSGDRDQHVCPWGKVQMVRSTDGGVTWSDPERICNTPLDDRDAGIIQTAAGTLVVNWFTSLAFEAGMSSTWLKSLESADVLRQWALHAEKLTPEIRQQWLGFWMRRSVDGGRTWEAPVKHLGSAPHGGIELSDGRLLFVGRGTLDGNLAMVVEESRDDGRSWEPISTITAHPDDDRTKYHEPHLVETADGRLVAMFRFHYHASPGARQDHKRSLLRQAESDDGGRTWKIAHPTPIQGYPPHLICLRDGTLVCVYGRRIPVYGEYACVSRDGGRTWDVDNEIQLAGALNGDLGYPASTELADGSVFTVYYQIHKTGEKTCLMGTHWRLK